MRMMIFDSLRLSNIHVIIQINTQQNTHGAKVYGLGGQERGKRGNEEGWG